MKIEVEQEADGRWIAEIPSLPGVMAYGVSRDEAVGRVKALALRVMAGQLEETGNAATPAEWFTVSA
jgi:predicted RNase H-like HicB family nuclease